MFEFVTTVVKKVFGDANERELRRIQPVVARVNDLEPTVAALSDAALAAKTAEFRTRLDNGASLDDLHAEAFAVVREVGKRTMGMRHYDCQLVGGSVLHQGKIAEMRTGEGKTLVATLPVYLNALAGKGVHVVTVNDYLAQRDAEWMSPIYRFLGMSVGTILGGDRGAGSNERKRAAYQSDITYGTNSEFGFDYLRDNMKYRVEDYVQRGHHYAIVDEVDSILIDEARTPLIISGPAQGSVDLYRVVDAVIPMLLKDVDFSLDEKTRNCTLTDEGNLKVEEKLGLDNLYDPQNLEVLHHVVQCLKAHHLFKRDRDYVVVDGEVCIVDENTGRLMHGRRWSDGLHQAVEAKERVNIQEENQTYATITYQNLYRMYGKLSGMTGTALTEAAEFMSIYSLPVVVIPTNRPIARKDHEDVVYKNQEGKFRAVMEEIRLANAKGQPVLVGTTSVEKSMIVANLLRGAGIPHEVLNAKQHDREAHIIAQAGRLGAVTISTNMAGRGTDIRLGGNPEELATQEVGVGADPAAFAEALERFKAQCSAEAEQVKAAGGLYIIGTERHESRRIDNQLRGRSGRQGDPGASKFFIALDDHLMRIFGSEKLTVWMERMGLKDDEAIEHRWVTGAIEGAQQKVEAYNFGVRKNLLEYDDVMNYQRKGVYALRRRALEGDNIGQLVDEAVVAVVGDVLDDFCDAGVNPESWNIAGIRKNLDEVLGIRWSESDAELRDMARSELEQRMLAQARELIAAKRQELGDEVFEQVARSVVLRAADELWRDHLLAIDRLRQGIGLRGYGQRNPVLEYKRDAYNMYQLMAAMRDARLLTQLLRAQVRIPEAVRTPQLLQVPQRSAEPVEEAPELAIPEVEIDPAQAPELQRPAKGADARAFAVQYGFKRNDPCPCGSGQKFKKCCGAETDAA